MGLGAIAHDRHSSCHPNASIILGNAPADQNNLHHPYAYEIDRESKVELHSFGHGVATGDGAR